MAYRALVLLGLFFSFSAHSAAVVSPVVQGYSVAAKTYQGAAAVAANTGFAAEGIINVGGRVVTAPASMRIAANAAQYAVTAVRLNPAGLALGAVAAWLLPYGIEYINGVLSSTSVVPDPVTPNCSWAFGSGTAGEMKAQIEAYYYRTPITSWTHPNAATWNAYTATGNIAYFECAQPAPAIKPPLTDADFIAPAAAPLPDAVADQLADTVPVPVSPPEFAPADVATGPAYTKPDRSTVEPRARITPAAPGQVTIDTYEKPLTNPDGSPVPADAPVQDTPEPDKDPCEEHPDRLGCAEFGTPDSDVAKTKTEIFSYTAEGAAFSGSCPAPLSILGKSLSYQPACDAMSMIRPLILGLASLMAGYILIGAFRET